MVKAANRGCYDLRVTECNVSEMELRATRKMSAVAYRAILSDSDAGAKPVDLSLSACRCSHTHTPYFRQKADRQLSRQAV